MEKVDHQDLVEVRVGVRAVNPAVARCVSALALVLRGRENGPLAQRGITLRQPGLPTALRTLLCVPGSGPSLIWVKIVLKPALKIVQVCVFVPAVES